MNIDNLLLLGAKYGLGAVAFVILCLISWNIISHILKTNNKILEAFMVASKEWQKVIDSACNSINQIKEETTRAHGYQRDEHVKLIERAENQIEMLTVMNENAKERGKALEKITENLEEQGKVLLRINGEKH